MASYGLTWLRRAAMAVASITAVPAPSRTRGSASTTVRERFLFLAEDCGRADMARLGGDALVAVSLSP